MLANAWGQAQLWLERTFSWAPPWLGGLVGVLLAAGLALLLYRSVVILMLRIVTPHSPFGARLIARARKVVGAVLVIIALGATIPAAQFGPWLTPFLLHLLLVAAILCFGWGAVLTLGLASELYLRRYNVQSEDNLLARKHLTQVNILRRAGSLLILLLTAGIALMSYQTVRQYGVSLFASAGAAGLIVGLAARPVLTNLLAGLQIAITQPIRLEDAVIVEGEFGWIETIGSTFVVVRLWDWRRMVLPISYFIEKPFQNWTYESAALIGTVMLYLDYSVPVDRLRAELDRILGESGRWDGKVKNLAVTDATEHSVQLRILVSARNSGTAFDLRCEVREKMIAFLQRNHPGALPRQRAEIGAARLRPVAERQPDAA